MQLKHVFCSAALALLALAAPTYGQQVLRVDELGTGGAFLDVQLAIDAAGDGDIVLVADGTYGGFTIDGKGVQVFAESGAAPVIKGPMLVSNLQSNQAAALHGLSHENYAPISFFTPTPLAPIIEVRDCLGSVHIQDCDLTSTLSIFNPNSPGGILVGDSSEVVIEDTLLNSLDGASVGDGPRLFALLVENSNVYAYGCTIVGPRGAVFRDEDDFLVVDDLPGSPAILMVGGTALLVDCQVTGGSGSNGTPTAFFGGGGTCGPTGPAAPAILMLSGDSNPLVETIATTFSPGVQGDTAMLFLSPGMFQVCSGGPAATLATRIVAGSLVDLPLSARSLSTTPVARPGESKSLTLNAEPFDLAWIFFSLDPGLNIYAPVLSNVINPTPNQFALFLGMLNGAGTKTKSFTLNPIGMDYIALYEQAFYFNVVDGLTSSNPRVAALIGLSAP